MIYFDTDYIAGVHPKVMERLLQTNMLLKADTSVCMSRVRAMPPDTRSKRLPAADWSMIPLIFHIVYP